MCFWIEHAARAGLYGFMVLRGLMLVIYTGNSSDVDVTESCGARAD
jgi:hypothetical protein